MAPWRNTLFVQWWYELLLQILHLLTLGVGEMSMGDCKVGLVRLEVKLVENSIN